MKRVVSRLVWPAILLLVNVPIAGRLFTLEYNAQLGSIEGTFIAIARQMVDHPRDLAWWPLWDGGFPFAFTYLPLLQFVTAGVAWVGRESAALAYHQATAAFYCLAPVALYFMARGITGRSNLSFVTALIFSLFSPCAWLFPLIRGDVGGVWNLRRMQILAFYGEGPHTAMLAILPLALLFLYLAVERGRRWDFVLAGIFLGLTVLANAFGATILAMAALSLVTTVRTERFWRNVLVTGAVAMAAYLWISPFVTPAVLAAIRADAPTSGGDYRFNARSFEGVISLAAGFVIFWFAIRRVNAPLRFFLHFTFLITGVVWLGVVANIYVVPQPHRYQIAMDMGLCCCLVFGATALPWRIGPAGRTAAITALSIVCVPAFRHDLRYAHSIIHGIDITKTAAYRVSRWFDVNMRGERVMVSGSYSLLFNDFTDVPQLLGGHDQMLPNIVDRIANYTLYTGVQPAARDAAMCVTWLRALGANAIHVPGPQSAEFYKPYAHPRKFDGVLPVLWREADDTIYDVPARSRSLAHVVPADALVRHAPVNGLDTAEMERYVRALDDPELPEAPFTWSTRHSAAIRTTVAGGEAISVQISYAPGWRATANGKPQPLEPDGLGLISMRPVCEGACTIALEFGTSPEAGFAGAASLILMAGTVLWMVFFPQRR